MDPNPQAPAAADAVPQHGGAVRAEPAWANYETVFTNAKAGMDGVDKDRVKKVVYEMSKNSAFFQHQKEKDAATDARVEGMRARLAGMRGAELASLAAAAESRLAQMEAERDLTRTWMCIDMDCFFCAVEVLDQPELKGKPFAVGGMSMISTASYEARRFGVRSAMPGFVGRALCPELVFVRPSFDKYVGKSHEVKAILREYDPDMDSMGLDEASLDVTDYLASHPGLTPPSLAEEIRRRVREGTGCTCSIGTAPNRPLAKICTDMNKPDGQYLLPAERGAVLEFVDTLPVRKVPGIGKVSERILSAFGIISCGDIRRRIATVAALFSDVAQAHLFQAAIGLGQTRHAPPAREGEITRKGISHERTFSSALSSSPDPEALEARLASLVEALAEDMGQEGLRGRTVTVKIKTTQFEIKTRAATLPSYVSTSEAILPPALKLLRSLYPLSIRLLGVRVSAFLNQAGESPEPGQQRLDTFVTRPAVAAAEPHDPSTSNRQKRPYGNQQPGAWSAPPSISSSPLAERSRGGADGGMLSSDAEAEAAAWDAEVAAATQGAADVLEEHPVMGEEGEGQGGWVESDRGEREGEGRGPAAAHASGGAAAAAASAGAQPQPPASPVPSRHGGLPPPSPAGVAGRERSERPSDRPASTKWMCGLCTYENDERLTKHFCEVCAGRRPMISAPLPPPQPSSRSAAAAATPLPPGASTLDRFLAKPTAGGVEARYQPPPSCYDADLEGIFRLAGVPLPAWHGQGRGSSADGSRIKRMKN